MTRKDSSEDNPDSGIFTIEQEEDSRKIRRRSDKILLGSNIAALISIIVATQNYVSKLEVEIAVMKTQLSEYRIDQAESVKEIHNLFDRHVTDFDRFRTQIKTDCFK